MDERFYRVKAILDPTIFIAFDDPLWVPLTGEPGNNPADQHTRNITTTRGGRFTPKTLGRSGTVFSLVLVWTDGPISAGDMASVVGSADAAVSTPVSVLRTSTALELAPSNAAVQLLGPTDDLTIDTQGVDTTAYISVVDLDQGELLEWLRTKTTIDNSCCTESIDQRVMELTGATAHIEPWDVDILYIDVTCTSPANILELPPAATVAVGKRVRITRHGLNGTFFHLRGDGGGEPINFSTFPIRFVAEATSVEIERGQSSWIATWPAPDRLIQVAAANTAVLATSTQLNTYVEWAAGTDNTLTLPSAALTPINARFIITLASGGDGNVIPFAGDLVDQLANKPTALARVGDRVVFERVANGAIGWASYADVQINHNVFTVTVDPALGANTGWDGIRVYNAAFLANGNFTLPTAPKVGTHIRVVNTSAFTVTLQAGGNVIKQGGTSGAARVAALNTPVDLVFVTGMWVAAS